MFTISERKIAGFTPRWAAFPGLSLLFDNPGASLYRNGEFEMVACDVDNDPKLGFYRRVHEGFEQFDPALLLRTYLFCPLPPASYHVTAFDVANLGDIPRCRPEILNELKELLGGLASESWPENSEILAPAEISDLAQNSWPMRFRYDKLDMFGRSGISLRLKPDDEETTTSLENFRQARSRLSKFYGDRFGIGAGPNYTPHVSIGYFANREGGELAVSRLPEWDARLKDSVGDELLEFKSASIYAFTSMETFFRKAV